MLRQFQYLIIQMASNFLSTDNSMIGRRFESGPGFFTCFWGGLRMLCLIFSGYFPVLAMLFSSLVTLSYISVVRTLQILHLGYHVPHFSCSLNFLLPFVFLRQ